MTCLPLKGTFIQTIPITLHHIRITITSLPQLTYTHLRINRPPVSSVERNPSTIKLIFLFKVFFLLLERKKQWYFRNKANTTTANEESNELRMRLAYAVRACRTVVQVSGARIPHATKTLFFGICCWTRQGPHCSLLTAEHFFNEKQPSIWCGSIKVTAFAHKYNIKHKQRRSLKNSLLLHGENLKFRDSWSLKITIRTNNKLQLEGN